MNLEKAFLTVIFQDPDNDSQRLIYADWLEERDDPESVSKAEFLRLTAALADAFRNAADLTRIRARLREVRATIDGNWLASLEQVPIEKCDLSFHYRCPKEWKQLTLTEEPSVRFCESCRKSVYFCHTIAEAQDHARSGHCVAVDSTVCRVAGDLDDDQLGVESMTLGIVDIESDEADELATDNRSWWRRLFRS